MLARKLGHVMSKDRVTPRGAAWVSVNSCAGGTSVWGAPAARVPSGASFVLESRGSGSFSFAVPRGGFEIVHT